MGKGLAAVIAVLFFISDKISALPVCERPEDAAAVQTAALQQEMMVAAFMCGDVRAYNDFVLSHRPDLQDSDRKLLSFFVSGNAQTGDGDYNLFKTELANASSLRSTTDRYFCARVDANYRAAANRPLPDFLRVVPYPTDTGSVRCPQLARDMPVAAQTPPRKHVRHRTWLGRLVDAVSD